VTRIRISSCLLLLSALLSAFIACGQEKEGHLDYNPFQFGNKNRPVHKNTEKTTRTSLLLPFFEDFTGYSVYPDLTKWLDFEVYINNTMGVSPIERGVATFDGLNQYGIPYDSFSNTDFRYADSLTSFPINMGYSMATPGDSVYFSFFYQAEGNGYYPLSGDSLMLYFKDEYGQFVKVWGITDSAVSLQPFQQVMIPITDSIYFDSAFQFRFVNIAAVYWADADWNIDYIRLSTGRNINDTAVNDIGFSANPGPLLNDYTAMPYRQFYVNPAAETAQQFYDSIHNNYLATDQGITYSYTAVSNTGTTLYSSGADSSALIMHYSIQPVSFPTYTTTITPSGPDAKVVFENTFFMQPVSPTDPPANDTIVSEQVFDNYLAYDDGSAEKSYYLNLFPPDAGEIAIEYHLNQPDTMQGMAIYFGRQIPYASYKAFSILVWSAIKGVNGALADNLLYEQDLYIPGYADTINHFWYYNFDTPLPLPAGTFFAGTIQPAEGSSDSLYFGLDVNRQGDNHAFYNVVGTWLPSQISGAIMMRPLLGQPVQPTAVSDVQAKSDNWCIMPNPAKDKLQFALPASYGHSVSYHITDILGSAVLEGTVSNNTIIDISSMAPGMYFVNLDGGGISIVPKKFVKL
jgi:hypothetical protein